MPEYRVHVQSIRQSGCVIVVNVEQRADAAPEALRTMQRVAREQNALHNANRFPTGLDDYWVVKVRKAPRARQARA
ncbi:hypothetical protein [Brachybacterium tyrofermentans]|uniref:hypothetical protein n=1 Tax=Brachybacterium tyrofermentans TaxID=47848 RepID=UPI0018676CD1|nr:hypothetical protein [Brachybacterium tyrofermentans]